MRWEHPVRRRQDRRGRRRAPGRTRVDQDALRKPPHTDQRVLPAAPWTALHGEMPGVTWPCSVSLGYRLSVIGHQDVQTITESCPWPEPGAGHVDLLAVHLNSLMSTYDPAMAEAVFDYCRQRLSIDPVPLTIPAKARPRRRFSRFGHRRWPRRLQYSEVIRRPDCHLVHLL